MIGHYCSSNGLTRLDKRFALKGTTPVYAPDREFDTENISLNLKLDPSRPLLKGRCRTRIRALTGRARTMTFDAVHFVVDSVRWDGKKTPFLYRNGKLVVRAPKRLEEGDRADVEIAYRVQKPKLGLYFLKPDRWYPRRPLQVWTQGEDEYARYWFPCHDVPGERTTSEMIVTVPAGFTAVSNGELVRTTHDKRTKTTDFHWRQTVPHAPYLMTLAVGRFSVLRDKWKGVPVLYYCEKGREDDARRAFSKTPAMIDFFSRRIGVSYPYAKYAQVAVSDFIYGGMENTSSTTQTDLALLDKRAALDASSDELVAHELAHQWFGDYLTCKDWSHAWLNESFATYFDALFKRHDKGEDEFYYALYHNGREYLEEGQERYRRPIVTRVYKHPTDLFDRHLYEKGSLVLYMLHERLGDDLFWKSIKTYVKNNKAKTVETIDLINAIEDATGRNMRRFFDEWVFGSGHPVLTVRSWWDPRKKEAHFRINQKNADTENTLLHSEEADVAIVTKKGEKRITIPLGKKSVKERVRVNEEPIAIYFDPDFAFLKELTFPRPQSFLIHQLRSHPHPLGRIEAAVELSNLKTDQAVSALQQALLNDSFWGVRAEAADALGKMRTERSATILLNALEAVDNHKVRRSIYAALRTFHSETIALEIAERYRKEKSYFSEANGLRAIGALRHPRAESILKEALRSESWNHILRIAAVDGMVALNSKKLIPLLLKTTKWGVPHRVRMAAIRGLAQLGMDEPGVQERLTELATDPFLLVQIAAVQALHKIGDERAVPALKRLTTGDWDGRLMRLAEEAILHITKDFQ